MLLTKENLEGEHNEGDKIQGTLLIQDYSIQLTKSGKEYVTGTVCAGKIMSFKTWSNSAAFAVFKTQDLRGKCAEITGAFNIYQDAYSIIINVVQEDTTVDPMECTPTIYNTDAYWDGLKGIVQKNVSAKGFELAQSVLFENEKLANEFKWEYAAKSHHDNVKSGLLAHTYKVVSLMIYTLTTYGLARNEDEKDLYILGALFHDIGKTKEMHMGVYTRDSVVTHRFLGIEMLDKKKIVEIYSEEWYYYLVSILLQHHGQWGEPCHSVVAQVTHWVDDLDAKLTLVKQTIQDKPQADIWIDDSKLSQLSL